MAALTLAGCEGNSSDSKGSSSPETTTIGTASSKRTGRDWDEIKATGTLKWGSDDSGGAPFEFRDPKNPSERIGFEVEIADELAKRLGVKIEFVQTEWVNLIPALERGDFDMAMSGVEITEAREKSVSFTKPYYIFLQQLVVRADEKSISYLAECKGRKVGTLSASAAENILKATEGVTPVGYDDNVRPYEDLALGRVDAVLLDLPIAVWYAKPNAKLKFAGEPFAEGKYGIAVRKNAPALLQQLDSALSEMHKDGTMKKIYEKWNLWNDAQKQLH
ncbi:MAG: ABC transporter substrate-binding protein [Candidatus Sumerlaeaceae bacterium]|nr:ABC transporter substrate-binding protein [Candidatus Sumerlaeaceae bacterium]